MDVQDEAHLKYIPIHVRNVPKQQTYHHILYLMNNGGYTTNTAYLHLFLGVKVH